MVHTLQLLHPKLEAQLALSKQVALLEALRELETHDAESLECLLPEYRHILKNEKELLAQYSRQPAHLDRLYGNFFSCLLSSVTLTIGSTVCLGTQGNSALCYCL